jgi:hypothetical protein
MDKKARRKLVSKVIELDAQIGYLERQVKITDGRTAIGKTRKERLETLKEKRDDIQSKLDAEAAKKSAPNVVESDKAELLPFEPTDDEIDEIKGDE